MEPAPRHSTTMRSALAVLMRPRPATIPGMRVIVLAVGAVMGLAQIALDVATRHEPPRPLWFEVFSGVAMVVGGILMLLFRQALVREYVEETKQWKTSPWEPSPREMRWGFYDGLYIVAIIAIAVGCSLILGPTHLR